MAAHQGRCLCGKVQFRFEDPVNWVAHCHCQSCRRTTGSAFTTFVGVQLDQASFTRGTPRVHESTPGVRRSFCGDCGTPLAYEADRYLGEIHFYLATLDDPEAFRPQRHVHSGEQLSWIRLNDALPHD
ncbi:GFA family protein [Rhodovibrionaceae bacterium A322]